MLPDPLHPAVTHLPLALAALLPLLAVLAIIAIRTRFLSARAWVAVPLLAALMAGGGWLALETGEHEEERVESVLAERLIEAHEARAQVFVALAAGLALISLAGLLSGRAGELGKAVTVGLSVVTLGFALAAGHSGGELVYRHGAAQAYAKGGATGVASLDGELDAGGAVARPERDDDDD